MPTYTQYRGGYNNTYSSASNAVLNNQIPLFEDYIQFRSSDEQYVLIIGDTEDYKTFTDATVYTVDGTSGTYSLSVNEYESVTASVTNYYFTYNSLNNHYYNQYQRSDALSGSLVGFALTGGVAICVVLVFISRLFSRRR